MLQFHVLFIVSTFDFNLFIVVSRFCLPSAASDYWNDASQLVMDSDLLEQWVSDVRTTWPVIAVSIACAFVIGYYFALYLI